MIKESINAINGFTLLSMSVMTFPMYLTSGVLTAKLTTDDSAVDSTDKAITDYVPESVMNLMPSSVSQLVPFSIPSFTKEQIMGAGIIFAPIVTGAMGLYIGVANTRKLLGWD
jgi:hypothetical protein